MRAVSIHHLLNEESLLCGDGEFAQAPQQVVRWHDDGVEPFGVAELGCPEGHPNIVSVDFDSPAFHAVFWQSANIGRDWRPFRDSHFEKPPVFFLSPECPFFVYNPTESKENLATCTPEKYSLSSCSNLGKIRNCFVFDRAYRADCLSFFGKTRCV